MSNINLLPWRDGVRAGQQKQFLVWLGGGFTGHGGGDAGGQPVGTSANRPPAAA